MFHFYIGLFVSFGRFFLIVSILVSVLTNVDIKQGLFLFYLS